LLFLGNLDRSEPPEQKAANLLLDIAALEKTQIDAAQQLQQLKEALAKTKHGDDFAIG
jgi:hypothetical protein